MTLNLELELESLPLPLPPGEGHRQEQKSREANEAKLEAQARDATSGYYFAVCCLKMATNLATTSPEARTPPPAASSNFARGPVTSKEL